MALTGPPLLSLYQSRTAKIIPFAPEKPIVLIDWDGCLANSMPRIFARLQLVANELKRKYGDAFNVPPERLQKRWTSEFNAHLQDLFGTFWEEAADLYLGKYFNHPSLPPKTAFIGAREFLESLLDAKIPFAIVSNGDKKYIDEFIHIFGWEKILRDVPVISSDNIKPRHKPHPFHFKQALLQLGIENPHRHKIIIIGDGVDSDMLGALRLADEENYKIHAIWISHDKPVACSLTSVNNFGEVAANVEKLTGRDFSAYKPSPPLRACL